MKKIIAFLCMICFLPVTIISANDTVIVGGDSIGIEGDYDGVYISGTYQFSIDNKKIDPSQNIHVNDLLVEMDGKKIDCLEQFTSILNTFRNKENKISVVVIRNGKLKHTEIISKYENNTAICGLYLKEKLLGIGTLTFYNPDTKKYAALGHSLSDVDNQYLQHGNIYSSQIVSIKKASDKEIGDKNGEIQFDQLMGTIEKNTEIGIYGSYSVDTNSHKKMEIAEPKEIHQGSAYFLTVIDSNRIEAFEITIDTIDYAHLNESKSISFSVNDERLKEKTGGIIHGISGSPIIQDGKIIGAITHVSMQDPTSGYAIYIGNMMAETN